MNSDDNSPEQKRMLILQGISGSGKSTFAASVAEKDPNYWRIVSRDTIRQDLLGEKLLEQYFAQQHLDTGIEIEVTNLEHRAIATHLAAGKGVIVDNTNIQMQYVAEYLKILVEILGAKELLHGCKIIRFDVDVDEAMNRIFHRGKRFVSRSIVQSQFDRLKNVTWGEAECAVEAIKLIRQHGRKRWYLPPFEVTPISKATTNLPKAIICDIDGTLAHRTVLSQPKVHLRSFYGYKELCTDSVDPLIKTVLIGLASQDIRILFVSGRKEKARLETEHFLARAFMLSKFPVKYELFMRDESIDVDEDGLDLSDDIVKARIFDTYIRNSYQPIGVIDDRKRVVAFWETLGLRVLNAGLLNEVF